MRFKKSIIIALFLCLLMISAVSAAENITDDAVSGDVSGNSISHQNDITPNDKTIQFNDISFENNNVKNKINSKEEDVASPSKEGLLSTKYDRTFIALQNKIDNAEKGSTIILENDYVYNEGFSTEGIKIDKSLTIDGNGHIDENHDPLNFHILGSNVVVHNLEVTQLADKNNIVTSANDKITPEVKVDVAAGDYDVEVIVDVSVLPEDVTGYVLIDVDGVGYCVNLTDAKGSLTLKGLESGNHDVSAIYLGNDKYGYASAETTFNIHNIPSNVEVELDDINYGEKAIIRAFLPKDATGTITVTIDGKPYTPNLKNGEAKVIVPGLKVGNYTVDVNYSGDNKYASSNNTTYFKVLSSSVVEDLEKKLEEEKAKVKTLNEEIEKRLLRETELNYQVQTLQKELDVTKNQINSYIASDIQSKAQIQELQKENTELKKQINEYQIESKPNLKLTTKTIKKSKNNQLKAILKFSGKAIQGKTVTFIFNGKIYKTKTEKNGLAKITIKKSVLKKIKGKKTYYYAIYDNKSIKKTIKITK